ncbi:MAG TPA: M28 family peptidase [Planctomycetota bacterium]|nr:M28 family peptidase [Planctomycetota bacterium]
MRTSTLVAVLATGLAACIGAAMANRNAADRRAIDGGAPVRRQDPQQTEIDKKTVLPLPAIRAPKGLGDEAFEHVRAITAFGERRTGNPPTPGWTRQLDYIEAQCHKLGLEVVRDTWTDAKEHLTFTNLSATIPGKKHERIVLCCHHDTKRTSGHADPEHNFDFVGANDGGSGVGVLLALAPVLLAEKREATIELVFFDGEESLDWAWNDAARALFGSKRFAKRHRDALLLGEEPRIEALVLLDMVGGKDLHLQEELYSTPRLRRILWSAAVACGHEKRVFQRAEAANDDHKPFLDVGIPALDLIDLNGNPTWHKPTDTLENVSPASLQITADLVLTMLPEIERAYVLRQN